MKLISQTVAILLLVLSAACSKEEGQPAPAKAVTDIIKTEAIRIDDAKKTLEDARQVDQVIMDSDAKQRAAIEKAQQ